MTGIRNHLIRLDNLKYFFLCSLDNTIELIRILSKISITSSVHVFKSIESFAEKDSGGGVLIDAREAEMRSIFFLLPVKVKKKDVK